MIDYDKVLARANELMVDLCPEMDKPVIRSRQVKACLRALVEELNEVRNPIATEWLAGKFRGEF